jgi:hypothetical protein
MTAAHHRLGKSFPARFIKSRYEALNDAKAQAGYLSGGNEVNAFEFNVSGGQIGKEGDALADYDGGEVDHYFVYQSGV